MCMTIQLTFENILSTEGDSSQTQDLLDQIVCWLFERLTDESIKNVVQIQAMDTLSIQMKKAHFKERVNMNFEYLVNQLAKANAISEAMQIFEFNEEFVRSNYCYFTLDNL